MSQRLPAGVDSRYSSTALAWTPARGVGQAARMDDQTSPWPEVVAAIQRANPDWYVELEADGVIYIDGHFSNALRVAAQAITVAPKDVTVAVRVQPERNRETIAIRHEGALVVQEPAGDRTLWRTYRLSGLVTPLAIANDAGTAQRARIDPPPWHRPSPLTTDAFAAVGLVPGA